MNGVPSNAQDDEKKKKVEKWFSRYTPEELAPYFAKYDVRCNL
jgi:hypothetical protein